MDAGLVLTALGTVFGGVALFYARRQLAPRPVLVMTTAIGPISSSTAATGFIGGPTLTPSIAAISATYRRAQKAGPWKAAALA